MSETIDQLTGLLTVNAFLEQLEAVTRKGDPLTLVMMDLDHLHGFNERYGHVVGDEWIKANASLFKEAFNSEHSIIGRYGGDELMAAVPARDMYEVYQQAEALRQRVEKDGPAVNIDGQPQRPGYTIALGLAAFLPMPGI